MSKSTESLLLEAMLKGIVVSSLYGRKYLNTSDVRKYISNLIKKGWIITKTERKNKVTKKRFIFYFIEEKNRSIV